VKFASSNFTRHHPPPRFRLRFSARPIHEDVTHGLGRSSQEVPAAVEALGLLGIHQSQVRLVDQGGGLKRLPGLLLGQLRRRQFAQLVVDERQELLGGVGVALFDGRQDARHIAHTCKA
jgi:hypothetical protein